MKHLLLFAIALILFITSCKIHRPTRIKTDGEYKGMEQLSCTDRNGDKCIKTAGQKYIMIHGIGSQHDAYSQKMIKRLSKYAFKKSKYKRKVFCLVGQEFVEIPGKNFKKEVKNASPENQIRVLKVVDESETKTNTYYSINWSVLAFGTKQEFKNQEFDHGPRYTGINKALLKKFVMMEKVSDAFNGSEPETIKALVHTISLIIKNGKITEEENINLISGSFGSQLFLGAMIILNNPQLLTANEIAQEELIQTRKEQRLNMFLLTNQINFMDKNINGWFKPSQTDTLLPVELNFNEVQIVAFRNPNDILCYYLPEKVAKNLFAPYIQEDNIEVYNAFYFNWPVRNDVGSAHVSVFKLKKLSKAVYYGMDAWGVKTKRKKIREPNLLMDRPIE